MKSRGSGVAVTGGADDRKLWPTTGRGWRCAIG
jgi:hypothetical protein